MPTTLRQLIPNDAARWQVYDVPDDWCSKRWFQSSQHDNAYWKALFALMESIENDTKNYDAYTTLNCSFQEITSQTLLSEIEK